MRSRAGRLNAERDTFDKVDESGDYDYLDDDAAKQRYDELALCKTEGKRPAQR